MLWKWDEKQVRLYVVLAYCSWTCPSSYKWLKNTRSIALNNHPNCFLPLYLQVHVCGDRGCAVQGVISKSCGIAASWLQRWALRSHPLGCTGTCGEDLSPRWCKCSPPPERIFMVLTAKGRRARPTANRTYVWQKQRNLWVTKQVVNYGFSFLSWS